MSAAATATHTVQADEAWRPVLAVAAEHEVAAEVDAAFAHALGFEIRGARFTLLAAGGRPAPGALITERADFSDVRAGTRVVIDAGRIGFDGAVVPGVPLDGLTFFDCTVEPPAERDLPYNLDPPGSAELDELLARVSRPGSFIPAASGTPFDQAISARLATARTAFLAALSLRARAVDDDPRPLRLAVHDLIGLGIGLTPSGDDYLVGALALLSRHPRAERTRAALAASIHEALAAPDGRERTTPVSRHFLLAACRRAFQHDLAAAAAAAVDGAGLEAAFAATAAIGSTSGGDALRGLVDACAVMRAQLDGGDPAREPARSLTHNPGPDPRPAIHEGGTP